MAQQNILINKSSTNIRDAFSSHIKESISDYLELNKNIDLINLHSHFLNNKKLLQKGNDQATEFHKAVYSSFDKNNFFSSDFWKSYQIFTLEVLNKIKNYTGYFGLWAIQRFPTIRFHFPKNISVFEFHRDSDYDHPIGEINCFYAINECYDTSALQIEKNLGFEDYFPLNLKPGEYALLNTSIYKHGDILNETNKTRVSMDFRFIPIYQLKEDKSSLTKGIKFSKDSYFIKEDEMINF